jgi:hypothetical protein
VLCVAFALRFYGLADRPPGTWFDPAYNGLDALRIMQRGGHVLFFPTNGGRESLFVYLLIPSIWLFDATPFAMRLVTALMGIVHVAFLFGFLYDLPSLLTPADPLARCLRARRLWLAVIGGMVLATSYWHLLVSLRAERPIMVPLLSVPLVWFLLKGWRSGSRKWFILAGLTLGLGAYTYGAARLLPVIVLVAILPELMLRIRAGRPAARASRKLTANLGFLVLGAVFTALPMIWYFATHFGQFSARAGSVAVWQYVHAPLDIGLEIGRNVPRVLGYFCCAGATTLYNGLPDFPGVSPLLAPFLALGLAGAILNSRHLTHRLIWLWWVIGLLPSITTIEAPHPLRMLVAMAPTAVLIALGPFYVGHWLTAIPARIGMHSWTTNRFATLRTSCVLCAGVIALALAALPSTWRAYFVEWADSPAVRQLNDPAALTLRDAVISHTGAGASVYLPMSRVNDPTLLYYLGGSFARQASLSAPAAKGGSYVIAPERDAGDTVWVQFTGEAATLLPPLTDAGLAVIRAGLAHSAEPLVGPAGEAAGWIAPLSVDPGRIAERPTRNQAVVLGPMLLTGMRYPDTIVFAAAAGVDERSGAAQALPVTTYWQADAPMRDEYEVLVHLVDDDRQVWGTGDGRPTGWVYPTSFWRPHLDTVAVQHLVRLQAATLPPPGRYWLAVAVYDPASGCRLPVTGGGDRSSADTYLAGPLKVPLPPPADDLLARMRRQDVRFGDVARLVGVASAATPVRSGEAVELTLLWQALTTPAVDYTVFVHLLDAEGQYVAGGDSQPVAGRYPTGAWSPGEVVADVHTFILARDGTPVAPGEYRLAVGMYDWNTGERLPVFLADGQSVATRAAVLDQPVIVTP